MIFEYVVIRELLQHTNASVIWKARLCPCSNESGEEKIALLFSKLNIAEIKIEKESRILIIMPLFVLTINREECTGVSSHAGALASVVIFLRRISLLSYRTSELRARDRPIMEAGVQVLKGKIWKKAIFGLPSSASCIQVFYQEYFCSLLFRMSRVWHVHNDLLFVARIRS